MELSQEVLDQYCGGQMELTNTEGIYRYRGAVRAIILGEEQLTVNFYWRAQSQVRLNQGNWIKNHNRSYIFPIKGGQISEPGDGRLILYSPVLGDRLLFMAVGDRDLLEPKEVDGLEVRRLKYVIYPNSEGKLFCSLTSDELPEFDPEKIILQVADEVPLEMLESLKSRIYIQAMAMGLENVINLEPKDLVRRDSQ